MSSEYIPAGLCCNEDIPWVRHILEESEEDDGD